MYSLQLFLQVRLPLFQTDVGLYIDAPLSAKVQSLGGQFSTSAVLSGVSLSLPPGPYFLTNSEGTISLYQAYRLYSDTQRVPGFCPETDA